MTHLQGLTTMVLTADDVDAAADWYSDTLGIGPYFRRPETGPAAYVEFRIGPDEDELGIMNRAHAPAGSSGAGGSTTYWQVDDVESALDALLASFAPRPWRADTRSYDRTRRRIHDGLHHRPVRQRPRTDAQPSLGAPALHQH